MSEQIGVTPTGQALSTAPRPLRVLVRDESRVPWRHRLARFSHWAGIRPAGWWLLLGAVVASGLGTWMGWWELRVAGLAAAIVAVCALAFMIGQPRFAVDLRLPGRRVSVGDQAHVTLRVANPQERRSRAARMELPIGSQRAALQVPALEPSAHHDTKFRIPTDRRAVVSVGPARSVTGDPFGLTAREADWTDVVEVFVHPRTVALAGRQAGFVHDLEGHATDHITPSDMSFHALREYAPGDDRRHVHWRSTARTGKLMVRQFEETRQSRMAIGLDLGTASYTDAEEFEVAVSVAASLALQAVREGNPLALLAGGRGLPAASGPALLDELCRVELRPRTTIDDTVSAITGQESNASIIALVTGGGRSLLDLRRCCASFGVDARVIGVRVALGEDASARSSANVSILQVGSLDDLPRTVRQVV